MPTKRTIPRVCDQCGIHFLASPQSVKLGWGKRCSPKCAHASLRRPLLDRLWAKIEKNGPSVEGHPELGPCWTWTGLVNQDGYGRIGVGRTGAGAASDATHRVAYRAEIGPIPDGMDLDHLCHTLDVTCPGGICLHRRCANPAHLQPVTAATNVRRGRSPSAIAAREGVCARGHRNWGKQSGGFRRCLTCKAAADAKKHTYLRSIGAVENRGEVNKASKLRESQVRAIIDRVRAGESQHSVARAFGVTQSVVSRIMSGKAWTHLTVVSCA